MLRAVGYTRVSTDEQAKEGVSLAAQDAKLNAYAQLYNLQLIAIESDEGVSAKSLDRDGLKRSLARIDRGECDGLLITKLDRLSRSILDWNHLIIDYFGEKPGKKLWSVADSIDTTTASGRMVLNMMMTVAQWERETVIERTRDALRFKIATDSRCGKLLYGKSINAADPRVSRKLKNPVGLVPNPAEVAAIDLMRSLRSGGFTYRDIADELTRLGIPTRDGRGPWCHTTVRKILLRASA
jgi:DNA invertase Pin-like site-specific DNA recombinase